MLWVFYILIQVLHHVCTYDALKSHFRRSITLHSGIPYSTNDTCNADFEKKAACVCNSLDKAARLYFHSHVRNTKLDVSVCYSIIPGQHVARSACAVSGRIRVHCERIHGKIWEIHVNEVVQNLMQMHI